MGPADGGRNGWPAPWPAAVLLLLLGASADSAMVSVVQWHLLLLKLQRGPTTYSGRRHNLLGQPVRRQVWTWRSRRLTGSCLGQWPRCAPLLLACTLRGARTTIPVTLQPTPLTAAALPRCGRDVDRSQRRAVHRPSRTAGPPGPSRTARMDKIFKEVSVKKVGLWMPCGSNGLLLRCRGTARIDVPCTSTQHQGHRRRSVLTPA